MKKTTGYSVKGFQYDSPDRNRDMNTIRGSEITMDKVPHPVMAYPQQGQPAMMYPGQQYNFGNSQYVDEIPVKQQGGLWNTNKKQYVDSVFNANSDKNFVQRYQNPNQYPVINNPDGSYSTHLMAYDKNRVYPTIVQDKSGKLVNLGGGDPSWDYANANKEYIEFPNEEQAKWFASSKDTTSGYKMGTQKKQHGGQYWNGKEYKTVTPAIAAGSIYRDGGVYQGAYNQWQNGGQYGDAMVELQPPQYNLYKDGGIHIKPSEVGSLHRHLGIPEGQKIPASKLAIHSGDSPAIRKKKQFAINASHWHHEYGGKVDNDVDMMKDGGNWIHTNPANKGDCTPMTKSTCTGHKRAFAETMKKHHGFHEYGGPLQKFMQQGGSMDIPADPNDPWQTTNINNQMNDVYAPVQQANQDNFYVNNEGQPQVTEDTAYPLQGHPISQKRRPYDFSTGFNSLLDGALAAGTYINGMNNARSVHEAAQANGVTGAGGWGMNGNGTKGDYSPNSGIFRPQSSVPTRAGNFLPLQQYGGKQGYQGRYNMMQNGGPHMDVGGGLLPVAPMQEPVYQPVPGMEVAPTANPVSSSGLQKFMGHKGDISAETNNPGNMKFAPWQKQFGAEPSGIPGEDGGQFAAFPDVDKGLAAYKLQLFGDTDGHFRSRYYKADTTVDAAMRKWSNGGYGDDIYPEIRGKKLGDLTPEQRDELVKRQIHRESPTMFNILHKKGYYREGGIYEGGPEMEQLLKSHGYKFEMV